MSETSRAASPRSGRRRSSRQRGEGSRGRPRQPPTAAAAAPAPADSAVINTGVRRSKLARTIRAGPNGRPSCSARLMQWLVFRMPLRAEMPASVMNPIIEATDNGRPASVRAATLPINASGIFAMTRGPTRSSDSAAAGSGRSAPTRPAPACRSAGWRPPAPGRSPRGGWMCQGATGLCRQCRESRSTVRPMSAPASGIGHHDEPAPRALAQDLARPFGLHDTGDEAQRDHARRARDQQVAEAGGRAAGVGEPHHHVDPLVALGDLRDDPTIGEAFQRLGDRCGGQAVERGALVVDGNANLRNGNLLFDLQINDTRHLCNLLRRVSATMRSASRSSPKILSAISARTPDRR